MYKLTLHTIYDSYTAYKEVLTASKLHTGNQFSRLLLIGLQCEKKNQSPADLVNQFLSEYKNLPFLTK